MVSAARGEPRLGDASRPRVIVLADDVIWQTRLAGALEVAGAEPVRARNLSDMVATVGSADGAVVDLTSRHYDPIVAIERARAGGLAVLAVGQHDDLPLRKRALAAGADRVLAYRKLFEDGPATLSAWLAGSDR